MTLEELKKRFSKNKTILPYANPAKDGKSYGGWVTDFHIHKKNSKETMKLNLNVESDRFLLFVLAVAWSRSGRWENSAFFVSYLKLVKEIGDMDSIKEWIAGLSNKSDAELEIIGNQYVEEEKQLLVLDSKIPTNNGSRCQLSLRNDILGSIIILYNNWERITKSLKQSQKESNYKIFIKEMRDINGLGPKRNDGTRKKMSMKILLILRELRIQKVYKNIPIKYCCVPDARVKEASKNIDDFKLSSGNSFDDHLKNSETISNEFGEWYDIPLFAYEDLI